MGPVLDSLSAHNVPKQAKKVDVSMVTAYNQCTAPTLTHRPSLAFPACVPAASSANAGNLYQFGLKNGKPDGSMSVKFQAARGDIKMAVKSKAIERNGSPYSGPDLTMAWLVRGTDNACGAGFDVGCTVVDFPWPIGLVCTAGSCEMISATLNGVLPGAYHAGELTNLELGQVTVVDEDGDDVFRSGLLVK